jgi:peptidoglycan glycosyltransferase
MLTVISSIANNGKAVNPYLVSELISPQGTVTSKGKTVELGQYFSPSVASQLNDLLRSNVRDKYSDSLFPGMQMCGKTGTAEVSDDDNIKPNGLFVGYSQRDDMPFAIIVIAENSKFSSTTAVPVASKVMKALETEYAQ